jgi:hypothetical protein
LLAEKRKKRKKVGVHREKIEQKGKRQTADEERKFEE